jgi:sugar phosphate isomerase/epimerase
LSLIGYCTNVHAGRGLEQTLANLDQYAVAVRQLVSTEAPLGLGLWLSAQTTDELQESESSQHELAEWFQSRLLVPYTMNAFPFGDFHGATVKYAVYKPEWWCPERADYTKRVVSIFDNLLPADEPGTISTLPIGWPGPEVTDEHFREAARQYGEVATFLARLEDRRGRHFRLCIEPEPGCLLQTNQDVVRFFDQHLRKQIRKEHVDRYLGVCHDICHSAVMFESQREVLHTYVAADIVIGKVQVSSAVVARPGIASPDVRSLIIDELSAFAEDRYLHQTVVRDDGVQQFFADLPSALDELGTAANGEWRVHFHVPLFVDSFGKLNTSQAEIDECLQALHELQQTPALEVETYAWNVLPPEMRRSSLAEGIAAEIHWLRCRVAT